jgi:hypothetical protein
MVLPDGKDFLPYYVCVVRFGVTSGNFIMSALFGLILMYNAFNMKDITGPQVFQADRVLQSSTGTDPQQLDEFIKQVYGTNSEILRIVNDTTVLPTLLPKMYEISGENSILRIDAIHPNFMLFSALWIASAFALAVTQIPSLDPLTWGFTRVMIVHVWNFIGLIVTIVIFSATTKWALIPTSNLFYALIGQVMAWAYQYFHMVECTQIIKDSMLVISHAPTSHGDKEEHKSAVFAIEMRKILYMEFSIVMPMLLVASIVPGTIGIDEWRIQTILFSSWTLFALLGLHLRFRKSLRADVLVANTELNAASQPDENVADTRGLDALGYLTYAIIMVSLMLLNAMGDIVFEDLSYATPRITQSRTGARIIVVVCAALVAETVWKTIRMRFFSTYVINGQVPPRGSDEMPTKEWTVVPAFVANALIIAVGSLLVKILIFSGLSDINGLCTWSV